MATSEKPPATEEERKQRAREKARLRKRSYDAKVRKPDAGGASPKKGTVLYLSDDTRAVLTRNRQRRRDTALPQVLDSNLVDSLLRVYAEQGEPEHPVGPLVEDETKANAVIARLLKDKEELEKQLKSRSEPPPLDWSAIERRLLAAHLLLGTQWVHGIAQRVLHEGSSAGSKSTAAAILQHEIAEHIRSLIEWVSKSR